MTPNDEDPRLVRLTRICLTLPEATRQVHGQHAGFLVRNKTFAWFLNDHHGDGIVAVNCKAPLGENTELAALDPARFYIPAYLGPRGWIGLRLDRYRVDWAEVEQFVVRSYRMLAPKRLLALLPKGNNP